MAEMTREQFIKVRMAEGFSKEAAEHAYDHTHDPAVEAAQEQKVPTKGERLEMIHEARQNNRDKKKRYSPDFKLSKKYLDVKKEIDEATKANDYTLAEKLSKQLLSIQIHGTIDNEEYQTKVDQSLSMSIASILAERKKYEAIITECEEKLDNFDVSAVQSKVDALTAEYDRKLKGKKDMAFYNIKAEYEQAVDELEHELIIIPMNDLKIRRFEAKEYFLIYEAAVKRYLDANKDLIRAEMENAKREEIRGSLLDLAEELEREDAKKAALGLEG